MIERTTLSNEYCSDFEKKELPCYQNIQYFEKISLITHSQE